MPIFHQWQLLWAFSCLCFVSTQLSIVGLGIYSYRFTKYLVQTGRHLRGDNLQDSRAQNSLVVPELLRHLNQWAAQFQSQFQAKSHSSNVTAEQHHHGMLPLFPARWPLGLKQCWLQQSFLPIVLNGMLDLHHWRVRLFLSSTVLNDAALSGSRNA